MQNEKNVSGKSKRSAGSIVLYVAASVVALIAVALLVNNIIMFKNIVTQYVAQGYPQSEVLKSLVPTQLLPGIFQSVALYGGVAVLLAGAGMIYQKVAKLTELSVADELESENTEDVAMEDNTAEMGYAEAAEEDSENE